MFNPTHVQMVTYQNTALCILDRITSMNHYTCEVRNFAEVRHLTLVRWTVSEVNRILTFRDGTISVYLLFAVLVVTNWRLQRTAIELASNI